MTWDPTWDRVFEDKEWGRYPPEDLIRFTVRHFGGVADRAQLRFAEIGCGPGANIWYLAREGIAAVGIDGSEIAIARARDRLRREGLEAELIVGDAADIFRHVKPASLDAVIDVCCLQCNVVEDVHRMIGEVLMVLKPGGRLFSMMSAAGSWGDGMGTPVGTGTFTDIPEGPYSGLGRNHFFTREEVDECLAGFDDVVVESLERTLDGGRQRVRHWVSVATKPA